MEFNDPPGSIVMLYHVWRIDTDTILENNDNLFGRGLWGLFTRLTYFHVKICIKSLDLKNA